LVFGVSSQRRVLSLANSCSANNLHEVPKARLFPEHADGEISVDPHCVVDGVQALSDKHLYKARTTPLSYGESQA